MYSSGLAVLYLSHSK